MNKTYLGLDLGGTFYKYGLISDSGDIIMRGKAPFRDDLSPEALIHEMSAALKEIIKNSPGGMRPAGLAVCSAGVIRPQEGLIIWAPNFPGWKNIHIGPMLAKELDMEVRLDNDGNLHALGEWLVGAGRNFQNMIGLTLGTGVGGGLILNGRIWNGAKGTAAEIGHISIEPEGELCNCGNNGCLENYASANAIAEFGRRQIKNGRSCQFQGDVEKLTSEDLFYLAEKGDELALEAFDRAGWALGIALTDVFNMLGLDGAVIGGGAAPAFKFIISRLRREFDRRVLAVNPKDVVMKIGELGNDAPLVGAPALFKYAV